MGRNWYIVDYDVPVIGGVFGHCFGGGAGLFGGPGEILAEIDALDGPAEGFELGDDSPVVGVAAGRRGKIARHCKGKPLYHKFAS